MNQCPICNLVIVFNTSQEDDATVLVSAEIPELTEDSIFCDYHLAQLEGGDE